MSLLNMRFGASRDSELMPTMQECSNWGLVPVSGQPIALLNLSYVENSASMDWSGVHWETVHLFLLPEPPLRVWISIRWTVSAIFPFGKSESARETDCQAVCFLAHRPSDSYYKAQHNTLTSFCDQIAALILSVCLSHMRPFIHHVLWHSRQMQWTDIHAAH